jgi:hydrogenase maturation protein HypF
MTEISRSKLARISARGVVQGVGFRPFIYQMATRHSLKGWVCNTSEDVKIEVEGNKGDIEQFYNDLKTQAPPLARIENLSITYHPPHGYQEFEIRHSITEPGKYQLITPDIATCGACLDEIFNPKDRRYRYPFTNCTNCGPRFTIIADIPYDRPLTTMNDFPMCPDCQAEYQDPLNRRFHAQPNACPVCGPRLELLDAAGNKMPVPDVIDTASALLKEGKLIALKGLGGFQLACDATSEPAVQLLRHRKRRPHKPFAVMVVDISQAKKYCAISDAEETLLISPQRPIVLLSWRQNTSICPAIAPSIKYLGMMLPYTPLHHILLKETGLPLVMTSGNISEEPIARDNEEAVSRLSGIADYFLVHNRDIYARYDDSVTVVEQNQVQIIRRARGYAPFPVHLNFQTKQVLACGAEDKNTFCLTRDNYAFISQHVGDMENLETMEHFESTIQLYQKLFRIKPKIIAHDLHPDYLATRYALELANKDNNLKTIAVQHHHAHIVSCMVDNRVEAPVIGVAFDGTGYGNDSATWGGEFLVTDYRGFQRMGHLEYLPLPGGAAAIHKPYRIALGYLFQLMGEKLLNTELVFLREIDPGEIYLVKQQVRSGLNTPLNSSMGRLFDAVSALIGIRDVIDYEGQAAIELEMAAYEGIETAVDARYPYAVIDQTGTFVIRLKDLFNAIIDDLRYGIPRNIIAVKFHNTIAQMIGETCLLIGQKTGIKQVALSGGVFQNRLLLRKVIPMLEASRFTVLIHQQVPCNDGGISLGQAVIANFNNS